MGTYQHKKRRRSRSYGMGVRKKGSSNEETIGGCEGPDKVWEEFISTYVMFTYGERREKTLKVMFMVRVRVRVRGLL